MRCRLPCRVTFIAAVAVLAGGALPEGAVARDFSGRVVAAGFDAPMSGARVVVIGSRVVTFTGSDGRFEFAPVDLRSPWRVSPSR